MAANWGAVPGELIGEKDPDAIDGDVTEAMDEVADDVYGGMVIVVYALVAAAITLIVAAVAGIGAMVAP